MASEHPATGARIAMLGSDRVTIADENGAFSFQALAAGYYEVAAQTPQGNDETGVWVREGIEPIELRVGSRATVRLHIVDSHQRPVSSALVKSGSLRDNMKCILGTRDLYREVPSDAAGVAVVHGVSGGRTTFEITAPGYATEIVAIELSDDPQMILDRSIILSDGILVSGHILDEHAQPVVGATVRFVSLDTPARIIRVQSTTNGAWAVRSLKNGSYLVSGWSERHMPSRVAPIEVSSSSRNLNEVIVKVRSAQSAITGNVVDERRQPVPGARVCVELSEQQTRRVIADDKGGFSLFGLPNEPMTIVASAEERISARVAVDAPQRSMLLTLQPARIAGIVTNLHAEPVPHAEIRIRTDAGELVRTRTNGRGEFELGGLPLGEHRITAIDPSHEDVRDTRTVNAGGNVHLVLPEARVLAGRVLLAGRPVTYYGLVVTGEHPESSLKLPVAIRNSDGRFEIAVPPRAQTRLVIVGDAFGAEVVRIPELGKDIVDLGIIEVHRGHTIRGRVTDRSGVPISNVMVVLAQRPSQAGFAGDDPILRAFRSYWTAITDQNGEYDIENIRLLDPRTPPRLRAASASMISAYQVVPDRDARIDLVLVPSGRIDGIVLGRGGEGRRVDARLLNDPATRESVEVSGGNFYFDHLLPGEYELSLSNLGAQSTGVQRVQVTAHEASGITFDVRNQSIIATFRVLDTDCESVDIFAIPRSPIPIAWQLCSGNTATIDAISPGRYRACRSHTCTDVEIGSAPNRQSFDIR